MKLSEALEHIRNRNVSVRFLKRTTAEIREIRIGIPPDSLFPTGPIVDPKTHGLIIVYDADKQAYRSIPIEGIREILINGKWQKIDEET